MENQNAKTKLPKKKKREANLQGTNFGKFW